MPPRIADGFVRKGAGRQFKSGPRQADGSRDNLTAEDRRRAQATRADRVKTLKDWYTPFLPRSHRKAQAPERKRLIDSNVFGVPDAYFGAHEGMKGNKALFIKGVNRAA